MPIVETSRFPPRVAIVFLLTVLAVGLCVRIELLNREAGFFLPRQIPEGANLKWRVAGPDTVRRDWERRIAEHDGSGLTQAQNAAILADVRRDMRKQIEAADLNSRLSSWVSLGLLQYLLIPATLLLAARLFRRFQGPAGKSVLTICLIANVVVASMVVYRGYLSAVMDS